MIAIPETEFGRETPMARAVSEGRPLHVDSVEARRLIRSGAHTGHTVAMAPEFVQGNLCILPSEYAADFAAFCQHNPKPCPLIGTSAAGDPRLPALGEDLDIRTDLPRYRVFRDGEVVDEPTDIMAYWRDDLVSFVLGCSFSFEQPLIEDGIRLRHAERGDNVAMYKTNIDTVAAGPFNGKMVVSMRPLYPSEAIRAIQITSRYPDVHGAPIHIGLPEQIGIDDLETPFAGDAPRMAEDEIPVFWACGVTPQVAVQQARPPLCITHKPGSMIITDLKNRGLEFKSNSKGSDPL
jgi:uncharacterized protein YcsI (UPF0317 family)